jgi:hypothetical protein
MITCCSGPAIASTTILSPELLGKVACRGGSPVLAAGFESSVPGLHFLGASAVDSYGPLMRFIAGAGYAARSITRTALAARRGWREPAEDAAGGYRIGASPRISQL